MATETPRWNRLDPDVRRSEIVAAARRIFSTRPYESVSITAIADEAGVSRALVTHYFGNKRELFLVMLQELGQVGDAMPRTDLDLPIEETVAINVDRWLDFMEANREIGFAMASIASLDQDPEIARVADDMRDGIVDRMLVNHFGSTAVPPQVRLVLRAYTGMGQVAVTDWLGGERATRAEVHALLTTGLLTLLREALPAVVNAGAAPPAGDA
ncbi:helix-turn-helix domain-containing protein [Conexibacter sp. JD483]|uniref:TetR/AcrR family transcriptional regulator n=1 Tax=unclassified Conexibacter TaxID=2627773 RepID=UPI00271CAF52|nr:MULTISPECIES: TetR/AcrR family transcriptional regulator [unclassified Conexibacter]MDO8186999.1 helix-turn-helix domain-containing protein [Conexibacter sp. CPCC 205706]MDO8200683.1 helix-turn-helix domain-containing protein [Conexibacter sp. CPCC 205762]MDR9371492.1 helix-turn-helix domain-containing protein [Conexibacter sp. JD483]